MSRGKQKLPTKQSVSMRISEEAVNHLERLGNGNKTKGFNTIYKYYVEHHNKMGTPLLVGEKMLRNSYISPMPS